MARWKHKRKLLIIIIISQNRSVTSIFCSFITLGQSSNKFIRSTEFITPASVTFLWVCQWEMNEYHNSTDISFLKIDIIVNKGYINNCPYVGFCLNLRSSHSLRSLFSLQSIWRIAYFLQDEVIKYNQQ